MIYINLGNTSDTFNIKKDVVSFNFDLIPIDYNLKDVLIQGSNGIMYYIYDSNNYVIGIYSPYIAYFNSLKLQISRGSNVSILEKAQAHNGFCFFQESILDTTTSKIGRLYWTYWKDKINSTYSSNDYNRRFINADPEFLKSIGY